MEVVVTRRNESKTLTIFRAGLFRALQGGGGGGGGFYNDETWHSYTLSKEDLKKCMNYMTHPLSSANMSIFALEISKLCYIKKYR